jgi:hypothetical protein
MLAYGYIFSAVRFFIPERRKRRNYAEDAEKSQKRANEKQKLKTDFLLSEILNFFSVSSA